MKVTRLAVKLPAFPTALSMENAKEMTRAFGMDLVAVYILGCVQPNKEVGMLPVYVDGVDEPIADSAAMIGLRELRARREEPAPEGGPQAEQPPTAQEGLQE